VRSDAASYELLDGEPLDILHHGERMTVTQDSVASRAVPPMRPRTPPSQPEGRNPPRRHREA
jgi:alpha,alpha-trehalose phosphorylase